MGIKAIEKNELRIGNICIDANGYRHDIINGWQIDEGVELFGIPLTEEMLLKCSFKQTKNLVGVRASYTFRDIRVSLSNSGHWYFKQRIIYLHDLQNIVFALYGKELEVNL